MFSATKKWVFLKVSSVVLVPLMLWFILCLVSLYDKSYEQIIFFFTTQPTKFLFSLFIIVSFFYNIKSELFEDDIKDTNSGNSPTIKCKSLISKSVQNLREGFIKLLNMNNVSILYYYIIYRINIINIYSGAWEAAVAGARA